MKSRSIFFAQLWTAAIGLIIFAVGTPLVLGRKGSWDWMDYAICAFGLVMCLIGAGMTWLAFSSKQKRLIENTYDQIAERTAATIDCFPYLKVPKELKLTLGCKAILFGAEAFALWCVWIGFTGVARDADFMFWIAGAVQLALFLLFDRCRFVIRGSMLRRTCWNPFARGEMDLREVRGYFYHKTQKYKELQEISFYDERGECLMTLPVGIYDLDFLMEWLETYLINQRQNNVHFGINPRASGH